MTCDARQIDVEREANLPSFSRLSRGAPRAHEAGRLMIEKETPMMKIASLLAATMLFGCLVPVRGGGRAGAREEGPALELVLPLILPPLVVISPGVSVVADLDEEVFYNDGYYYARRGPQWYHAREPRGAWARVDSGRVAPAIAQSPPGRYRQYRGNGQARSEQAHERRDERRDERNPRHD
jgi:hypothetical protein